MPDSALREVLARSAQMRPWDGRSQPLPEEVLIRPLAPDLVEDFLWFFDREGFRDNPFWADCYCMEAHLAEPEEGTRRTAEQNREEKRRLIRSGKAQGYLAYAGGYPVGWLHAAPRVTLAGLMADEKLRVEDPERVGSVYCFVIAPPHRRRALRLASSTPPSKDSAPRGCRWPKRIRIARPNPTRADTTARCRCTWVQASPCTVRQNGRSSSARP